MKFLHQINQCHAKEQLLQDLGFQLCHKKNKCSYILITQCKKWLNREKIPTFLFFHTQKTQDDFDADRIKKNHVR